MADDVLRTRRLRRVFLCARSVFFAVNLPAFSHIDSRSILAARCRELDKLTHPRGYCNIRTRSAESQTG